MKKNKIFATLMILVLCLGMMFTVIGCGPDKEPDPKPKPPVDRYTLSKGFADLKDAINTFGKGVDKTADGEFYLNAGLGLNVALDGGETKSYGIQLEGFFDTCDLAPTAENAADFAEQVGNNTFRISVLDRADDNAVLLRLTYQVADGVVYIQVGEVFTRVVLTAEMETLVVNAFNIVYFGSEKDGISLLSVLGVFGSDFDVEEILIDLINILVKELAGGSLDLGPIIGLLEGEDGLFEALAGLLAGMDVTAVRDGNNVSIVLDALATTVEGLVGGLLPDDFEKVIGTDDSYLQITNLAINFNALDLSSIEIAIDATYGQSGKELVVLGLGVEIFGLTIAAQDTNNLKITDTAKYKDYAIDLDTTVTLPIEAISAVLAGGEYASIIPMLANLGEITATVDGSISLEKAEAEVVVKAGELTLANIKYVGDTLYIDASNFKAMADGLVVDGKTLSSVIEDAMNKTMVQTPGTVGTVGTEFVKTFKLKLKTVDFAVELSTIIDGAITSLLTIIDNRDKTVASGTAAPEINMADRVVINGWDTYIIRAYGEIGRYYDLEIATIIDNVLAMLIDDTNKMFEIDETGKMKFNINGDDILENILGATTDALFSEMINYLTVATAESIEQHTYEVVGGVDTASEVMHLAGKVLVGADGVKTAYAITYTTSNESNDKEELSNIAKVKDFVVAYNAARPVDAPAMIFGGALTDDVVTAHIQAFEAEMSKYAFVGQNMTFAKLAKGFVANVTVESKGNDFTVSANLVSAIGSTDYAASITFGLSLVAIGDAIVAPTDTTGYVFYDSRPVVVASVA